MLPALGLMSAVSRVAELASTALNVAKTITPEKAPNVAAQVTSAEGGAGGPKNLLGVQSGETELGEQLKNPGGAPGGVLAAYADQVKDRNNKSQLESRANLLDRT